MRAINEETTLFLHDKVFNIKVSTYTLLNKTDGVIFLSEIFLENLKFDITTNVHICTVDIGTVNGHVDIGCPCTITPLKV